MTNRAVSIAAIGAKPAPLRQLLSSAATTVERKTVPFHQNYETAVYPVTVDPTSKQQVINVAVALCPNLGEQIYDNENSISPQSSFSSDEEEPEAVMPPTTTPNLTVSVLTGGLSNELFVVRNTEGNIKNNDAVLVRIHPDAETAVVDRDVENKLVEWLSQNSMAPLLYGRFENGRVEEFYENAKPLTLPEMHEKAAEIGQLMGRLHALDLPAGIFPSSSTRREGESDVSKRIENWIGTARSCELGPPLSSVLDEIEREWTWLKQVYSAQQAQHELSQASQFLRQPVLTHMDCQSENLLKVDNELKVIDYEYAGINPRGMDIANTFCEFCNMNGLCANYADEYPSIATQHDFLKAYVATTITGTNTKTAPSENYLNELCDEIGRYTAFSHVQWAVWSLIQLCSPNNHIDFDYAAYAQHRMEGYRYFKERFWTKA